MEYRDFAQKIDRNIIAKTLSPYFKISAFSFKKMDGYENASFYIEIKNQKYVLRIYNALQFGKRVRSKEGILTELEFINFLRSGGFLVPDIKRTNEGALFTTVLIDKTEHFAILTDFIGGYHIKKLSPKQIMSVAEVQAKMHIAAKRFKSKLPFIKTSGPLGMRRLIRDKLKDYEAPQNRKGLLKQGIVIIDFLDTKINKEATAKYSTILIHGDIHSGNLKFTGDDISGIFDFDDMRTSIAPDDIGAFLMEILKSANEKKLKERATVYFNQYAEIKPITRGEISLSIYFAAQRRLVFKMLRFMGLWEDEKSDSADEFKKVLNQINKIIKLATDPDILNIAD